MWRRKINLHILTEFKFKLKRVTHCNIFWVRRIFCVVDNLVPHSLWKSYVGFAGQSLLNSIIGINNILHCKKILLDILLSVKFFSITLMYNSFHMYVWRKQIFYSYIVLLLYSWRKILFDIFSLVYGKI